MAYRKSIRTLNKERKREWSRRAVAAKERKRMERTLAMLDVGGIRTDGILGEHSIRILSYGDEGRHYAITVDGEHRQARTERGILRCVAQRIGRAAAEDPWRLGLVSGIPNLLYPLVGSGLDVGG